MRKFFGDWGPDMVIVAAGLWGCGLIWMLETRQYGIFVLLLVPAVMIFAARHVHRAHVSRKAAIRSARDQTRWPKLLRNTLKLDEGERVVYETRMHPAVMFYNWKLVIPVLVAIAAPMISFWVVVPIVWVALCVVIAMVAFCVMIAPAAFDWWFTRRCFTDRRVIVITGILRKDFKAINLVEIRVPSHTEESAYNAVLQVFGIPQVWHWTFDTLVQDDPFKSLPWSVFPSPVGDLLEEHAKRQTSDAPG